MPPCPDKSVRIPNWKADGRGIQRGQRETVTSGRYALGGQVSPFSGHPMTCLSVRDGGSPSGSRCFSEHSRARKNCNILVDDELRNFPLGFYAWKLHPLFQGGPNSLPLVCPVSTIFGDSYDVDSRTDDPLLGSILLLGPYPLDGTRRTAVKCIPLELLWDPGFVIPPDLRTNIPQSVWSACSTFWQQFWTLEGDTVVPTPEMLLDVYRRYQENGLSHGLGIMYVAGVLQQALQDAIDDIRNITPAELKKVRLLARLLFQLGMYQHRWAGPGRPYPLTNESTVRRVGGASNPISDSLVGKMVVSGLSGVRIVTRGAHPPADAINEENRLGNMEWACLASAGEIYESLSPPTRTKIRRAFRCGTSMRFCDGSGYVVSPYSMMDLCFGSPGQPHVPFVARGDYCVRMASKQLVTGVINVNKHLYKSPPAWARFEGSMDPSIDPGDPSD